MPVPINIPKLGMTMTETSVMRWLVKDGDPVDKGATVAEVKTDKRGFIRLMRARG